MRKLFLSLTDLILLFIFFLLMLTGKMIEGWNPQSISVLFTILFILGMYILNFYFYYKKSLIFNQQFFLWAILFVMLSVIAYYTICNCDTPLLLWLNNFALFVIAQIVFKFLISNLNQYKEALEHILLDGEYSQDFKNLKLDKILDSELYRSRRYNHTFNVHIIDFSIKDQDQNQKVLEDMLKKVSNDYLSYKTYENIRNHIRRSDILCNIETKQANHQFCLVCPESEKERIQIIEQKLGNIADEMNVKLTIGSASFPSEALTGEQLIRIAYDRIKSNNTN